MVSQHTKDLINKWPYYSDMKICPLQYHGYRVTDNNIKEVIAEIEYELSVRPEHADVLLDHVNNLKKQLSHADAQH